MQDDLKSRCVSGFFFVSVIGTLLHFAIGFFGYSPVLAVIAPVNESVWEHLKLLYFPELLWCFLNISLQKKYPCHLFSQAMGILTGILFTLVVFYTYSGILGEISTIFDILLYYAAVGVMQCTVFAVCKKGYCERQQQITGALVLILLCGLFALFTFFPPSLALFTSVY